MSVIFDSSIHRALGVAGPLDFKMIQEAARLQVREDQSLDWKEVVGDAADVASDVAAMANAKGGLLVFGVRENRATSGAEELRPVDISDSAVRSFRSKLYARLNPPVPGLVVSPLADPDAEDSTVGVLVVDIPESPESPHVVGAKKNLGVPRRVGAQTEWMAEWEIERAYQDRFARRVSDSHQLDTMLENLEDHLDMNRGGWIAGVSRPTVPRSRAVEPPDRNAAVQAASEAVRLSMRLFTQDRSAVRPLLNSDQQGSVLVNPRVGLRRWVMRDRQRHDPEEGSYGTHLELHHDGGLVFAQRLGGWGEADLEKHFVPVEFVVGYAIDFAALLGVAASRLGTGHTLVRVRLVREDGAPFALEAPERVGQVLLPSRQPPWTIDLNRILAVDHAFPNDPRMGDASHLPDLRTTAQVIAGDVVSQFGYSPDQLEWPAIA